MKDDLGDRMKAYEDTTRFTLSRKSYTLIRVDGRAFHTYTKGLERPFDLKLMADMDAVATYLCEEIDGAQLAYVQSDEISILMTDFASPNTEMWFGGTIQKIVSLAAALATAKFNELRPGKIACFDARVWQVPSLVETENYFIWRQLDASRNSVSQAVRSVCSHKECEGKSSKEQQEMLFQKGINWNDYSPPIKRGRVIKKVKTTGPITYTDKRTGEEHTITAETSKWDVDDNIPVFAKDRDYLNGLIPKYAEQQVDETDEV